MDKEKLIDDMEKALRANCTMEELSDLEAFDLMAVNMVYHGYGNITQALAEFAEKLKNNCESLDSISCIAKYNDGYSDCIYDLIKTIDETLKEFLNERDG